MNTPLDVFDYLETLFASYMADASAIQEVLNKLVEAIEQRAIDVSKLDDASLEKLVARANLALLIGDIERSLYLLRAVRNAPAASDRTKGRARWGFIRGTLMQSGTIASIDQALIAEAFASTPPRVAKAEFVFTLQLQLFLGHSQHTIRIPFDWRLDIDPPDLLGPSRVLSAVAKTWDDGVYDGKALLSEVAEDESNHSVPALCSLVAGANALSTMQYAPIERHYSGQGGTSPSERLYEANYTNAIGWLASHVNPLFDGATLLCLSLACPEDRGRLMTSHVPELAHLAVQRLGFALARARAGAYLYEVVREFHSLAVGNISAGRFVTHFLHFGRAPVANECARWYELAPPSMRRLIPSTEHTVQLYEYIAKVALRITPLSDPETQMRFAAARGVVSTSPRLAAIHRRLTWVTLLVGGSMRDRTAPVAMLHTLLDELPNDEAHRLARAELIQACRTLEPNCGIDDDAMSWTIAISEWLAGSDKSDSATLCREIQLRCPTGLLKTDYVDAIVLCLQMQSADSLLAVSSESVNRWLKDTGL